MFDKKYLYCHKTMCTSTKPKHFLPLLIQNKTTENHCLSFIFPIKGKGIQTNLDIKIQANRVLMFSWAKLSSVLRKFDSMLHLTFKATFHATIENYATFLLIYSYFAPKKDHSIKFTTKRWHGLQTISIKFTIKGGMDCKLSFNVAILRTSCPKATLFKAPLLS